MKCQLCMGTVPSKQAKKNGIQSNQNAFKFLNNEDGGTVLVLENEGKFLLEHLMTYLLILFIKIKHIYREV